MSLDFAWNGDEMKNHFKHFSFYVAAVAISVFLILAVLKLGPTSAANPEHAAIPWASLVAGEFTRNVASPISGLIVEILTILAFSRLCSFVLKRLGQPQVVGEMIAGLLLGKSF